VAAAEGAAALGAPPDRVGIGWRDELALGIMTNLEQIDVLEVIADDLFSAPRRSLRAMRTLARQKPIVLHGVSLGLASVEPVDDTRLELMARLVGALEPELWSEHLAFVRAGRLEVGHLAAPPRSEATLEGTRRNAERAAQRVGAPPALENVASLLDPPGSTLDEAEWLSHVLSETRAGLLLDCNNLRSNAENFGFDPIAFLDRIPLARVQAVHIAGGRRVRASNGSTRLLDDHRHDVPDPVYQLLTEIARRAPQPLTVILERDGAYPAFERLLAELTRARRAVAEGRRLRAQTPDPSPDALPAPLRAALAAHGPCHRAAALQTYLARLYVDASARERFLADPRADAEHHGLAPGAVDALASIDRAGLELAVDSFARKRQPHTPRANPHDSGPSRHAGWGKWLWGSR
jgi:uncharacterized protein (UPF0276 family)